MFKKSIKYSLIVFLSSVGTTAFAQCAMCRAALGGDGNRVQAQAVNDGIVYLMIIPYVLVVVIAYGVYRIRKNRKKAE
jgi:hypothetical protein